MGKGKTPGLARWRANYLKRRREAEAESRRRRSRLPPAVLAAKLVRAVAAAGGRAKRRQVSARLGVWGDALDAAASHAARQGWLVVETTPVKTGGKPSVWYLIPEDSPP